MIEDHEGAVLIGLAHLSRPKSLPRYLINGERSRLIRTQLVNLVLKISNRHILISDLNAITVPGRIEKLFTIHDYYIKVAT